MQKESIDQKDFAAKYAECGNAYEAARFAGASRLTAALEGLRLLCSRTVRRRVMSAKLERCECEAAAGLRRIAFGRVNDAVALMFTENPTEADIADADLYCLSEIKRDRSGKVEMKFFDRQRALEQLLGYERYESENDGAKSLISAIYGEDEAT